MTDITIPPAALEAGARAITMALLLAVDDDCGALALTDDERMELASAAFIAMIEAWPYHYGPPDRLILPLPPQDASDEGQPDETQEWADYDPDC